ncbi:MAG: FecR family protein [Synergistaceae bacterium]|jgi:hypothetical protein|nr:FecR family protein [Synergistaceae bacterium]
MKFSKIKNTLLLFLPAASLILLCPAPSAWSADSPSVGSVTSSVPQAGAVREGGRTPLSAGGEIFVEDALFADETGQLEVAFEDGTTLDLGPSSEVQVRDFSMTEEKNSFHSELIRGAARLVTGSLVKRNPGGFKISTPRSTIGIRGTEVLLVVRGGDEILTVSVLGGRREGDSASASDTAYVTVIDRQTGEMHRITEPGWVFTRSKSGSVRLTKPNPEKRAAIDVLVRMTGAPTEEIPRMPADFNENVDKVLEEHPDEILQAPEAPSSFGTRRPPATVDDNVDGNVGGNMGDNVGGNVGDNVGGNVDDNVGGNVGGRDGQGRVDESWKNELPGESIVGAEDPRVGKSDGIVRIGAEPVVPVPRAPSVCD